MMKGSPKKILMPTRSWEFMVVDLRRYCNLLCQPMSIYVNIGSSNKIDVRIKLFVDDVWLGRCVVSELLRYVLHEKLRICVTVFLLVLA